MPDTPKIACTPRKVEVWKIFPLLLIQLLVFKGWFQQEHSVGPCIFVLKFDVRPKKFPVSPHQGWYPMRSSRWWFQMCGEKTPAWRHEINYNTCLVPGKLDHKAGCSARKRPEPWGFVIDYASWNYTVDSKLMVMIDNVLWRLFTLPLRWLTLSDLCYLLFFWFEFRKKQFAQHAFARTGAAWVRHAQ